MAKIKIAHLVNVLGPAGKERGILKIVSQMDQSKFDVHIIVMSVIHYPELLGLEAFTVHQLAENIPNNLKKVPKLARLLRQHQFDIIYTHSWNTLLEGYLGALLAGTPIKIHGEHGTFERSGLKDKLQKWLWGRFDSITVVAGDLGNQMRTEFGYRKDNIRVVYNGINHDQFYKNSKTRDDFRNSRKIDDYFVVGTIGRLHPVKDHPTLIRGFAKFKATGVKARLVLLATGKVDIGKPYTDLIKKLDLKDDIVLEYPTDTPEAIMNSLDIFVLSSISEGCSNVTLEALACGTPVVATRTGGNPELVVEGENGLLFEVGDDEELARHLKYLYDHPELRQKFSESGIKRIEAEFTISRTVANYQDLFTELYQKKVAK